MLVLSQRYAHRSVLPCIPPDAENNVNILDISQTIVGGFFNMMMIVDVAECKTDFAGFNNALEKIGEDMGCTIKAQREDIFDKI